MRYLITGGVGFIGSHLCDELLRRGDDLVLGPTVEGRWSGFGHTSNPTDYRINALIQAERQN